jgi:serine phosphatase RsbU (regulator of sigma subunit)
MLPGDLLLAYTDGVTDATGPAGVFGEARLLAAIAGCAGDWRALLDCLTTTWEAHAQGADRHDDITILMVVRQLPGP